MTRRGDSDRDRPARERIAAEQGDYKPSTATGDPVERRGPGGGRFGPLVRRRSERSGLARRSGPGDGSREQSMVPPAEFRSYYGRQILKTPAWENKVAYYFFAGGLSAGCALLAAGADLTGRPRLRKGTRVTGVAALGAGTYYLISDLGRPDRFHHMLRVAKPTSPLSVGTWLVTAYGPGIGLAAAAELVPPRWQKTLPGRLIRVLGRPGGLAAAALAPGVASYGAVLLAQTAVPAWNSGHAQLPFVFTSSAAASAGGLGMLVAPPGEAEPARRMAVAGAAAELTASRVMEARLGLVGETYRTGDAGRYARRATALTAGGGLGAALLGHRSRTAAALSGLALMAGGLFQRLAILHAGIQSTEDPKYVVEPQRQRLAERGPTRPAGRDAPR
jgi:formate-dependent nitrite reductase membrane component NrfD